MQCTVDFSPYGKLGFDSMRLGQTSLGLLGARLQEFLVLLAKGLTHDTEPNGAPHNDRHQKNNSGRVTEALHR